MSDNRDPYRDISSENFFTSCKPLHQILDISNPHEYARVLLNLVTYNFLLKLYIYIEKL